MRRTQLSPHTRLAQMKQDAAVFFRGYHRPDLYVHAEAVLELATTNRVIDVSKLGNGDDGSLNERLAMLILCHPVEVSRARGFRVFNSKCGEPTYSSILKRELEAFCSLRELDEKPEKGFMPAYADILREPKLALLARIVDLALLHDPSVTPVSAFSGDPGIFYRHRGEWEETRRVIAERALRVYAPFAEMFGYRNLLNRIREIAYFELDQDYVEDVTQKLDAVIGKVERTRGLVEAVLLELTERLSKEGIRHKILIRNEKSLGSILEKFKRRKDLKCDVERLHDLVAFKIVTETESEAQRARIVLEEVIYDMRKRGVGIPYYAEERDYIKDPKPNGYRSLHIDHISCDKGEFVDFEAIIRTQEMDDEATNGAYAHHIYKGNADLHGRESLLTYARYISALSDPEIFDKISVPAKGVPLRFLINLNGLFGARYCVPFTAYSGDTWLDVVALGLAQVKKEHQVIVVPPVFRVISPARVSLGKEVGIPETREITIATGGVPPVYGETARNLIKAATTVEGATLAHELSKLK